MASCTFSAFIKASPPRLLFSTFCFLAATFVFALAFYMLLLSSASVASLASFFPDLPAASIIYSNCRNSRVGDDRGSELFHSWSDKELFKRALSAEAKKLSMEDERGGFQGIASSGMRSSLFYKSGGGEGPGDDENMNSRVHTDSNAKSSSLLTNNVNNIDLRYSTQSSNPSFSASPPSSHSQASCWRRKSLQRRRMHHANSKIAFMFLTQGALPFTPLWNQFFHGHEHLYNIYVHLDPFRVGVFERNRAGVFWGRLIPPDLTKRGAPSLVAAERRLLANALLDDPLNHYFALLSERCIPLESFRKVYNHVTSSEKSFIEILTDAPTLHGRYMARGAEAAMLPEVPLKSFRVGSQFFVLVREHAVGVVSDEKIWGKFKRPCVEENNCYAEEHYFPTLIDMEDGNCATRMTLTNVDWSLSAGDGHPRTYTKEEVGKELIVSLRGNETFLFARKFADECLEPLLELSSFVFEEEGTQIVD